MNQLNKIGNKPFQNKFLILVHQGVFKFLSGWKMTIQHAIDTNDVPKGKWDGIGLLHGRLPLGVVGLGISLSRFQAQTEPPLVPGGLFYGMEWNGMRGW